MAGFGVDRDSAAGGSGSSANAIPVAIVDVKGDLIVATAPDVVARVAVGANDTMLMADSAQTAGVKWGAPATVRTALGVPTNAEAVLQSVVTTKGDLIAGTAASTTARKAVGTDGQALQADSSQTTGLVYIDNPSRPNLLINPNWQIDQINEGALYTVNAADVRGPDGWSGTSVGAGVFKLRTLADPDNAALKCLEITCTTADAAIVSTDDYFIYTAIEGYDAAALMIGTSAAQSITAQFKFKTLVTGVYGVSVANSALNRRYIGTITVADTSEHEYTVSLTLDTAGTWLYTNGVGCYLRICLAAGTNFQAAAGAWAAGAEQTTSAQTNFMSNTANIAYLKRVQFIPGALVQAYRPADFQKELAKAQRYQEKNQAQGIAAFNTTNANATILQTVATAAATSNRVRMSVPFKVSKRALPTLTYADMAGTAGKVTTISDDTFTNNVTPTIGTYQVGAENFAMQMQAEPGFMFHWYAVARLS